MKRTNSSTENASKLSSELTALCYRSDRKSSLFRTFLKLWSPTYRIITIQMLTIMFCVCLTCYGFLLNPQSLSGNLLVNNAAMSFFEGAGFLMYGWVGSRAGRVRLLEVTFFLTGILILSDLAIPVDAGIALATVKKALGLLPHLMMSHLTEIIGLVFIGKMCNSIGFAATFNYAAELYPTHLRGTAVGCGSSAARIGGLIAPQILQLKYTNPILPSIAIGSVSLFAAVIRYCYTIYRVLRLLVACLTIFPIWRVLSDVQR